MPRRRMSKRPLCSRTAESATSCELPSGNAKRIDAPVEKSMRPALVGSHFNSPRMPKMPAIRPTGSSLVELRIVLRFALAFGYVFFFFVLEFGRIKNLDGNAAFRSCTDDRAQRLRHATV